MIRIRIRSAAGRWAVLAVGIGFGGCLEFEDTTAPPGGGEPFGQVGLFLVPDRNAGERLQVDGRLYAGEADGGARQILLHDTLRVAGVALLPDRIGPDAARRYSATLGFDGDRLLEARFPPLRGSSAAGPLLRWELVRTPDPDTVVLQPGEDLVLHLELPTVPADTLDGWAFQIEGGINELSIRRAGLPPETIRIERALLPEPVDGQLRAVLNVRQTARPPGGDAAYPVEGSLATVVKWTVRVLEPDGTRATVFRASRRESGM